MKICHFLICAIFKTLPPVESTTTVNPPTTGGGTPEEFCDALEAEITNSWSRGSMDISINTANIDNDYNVDDHLEITFDTQVTEWVALYWPIKPGSAVDLGGGTWRFSFVDDFGGYTDTIEGRALGQAKFEGDEPPNVESCQICKAEGLNPATTAEATTEADVTTAEATTEEITEETTVEPPPPTTPEVTTTTAAKTTTTEEETTTVEVIFKLI